MKMSFLTRPSALMTLVWVALALLFYTVPLAYVHEPGILTWLVIFGGVALFGLGDYLGGLLPSPFRSKANSPTNTLIFCAIVGVVGISAMSVDKLFLSGIDWSIGITSVREQRAVDVVANIPIKRSVLLYFGYLTFSFSCVAVTMFILLGERLTTFARICGQISVLPMVAYAILFGGRMPILVVILLVIGACITRRIKGMPVLPAGQRLWLKLTVVAVVFSAYSFKVWDNRRQVNKIDSYSAFLTVASVKWEVTPSPWLNEAVRNQTIPVNLAMNLVSSALYLTHSPTTVQRMLEHRDQLSMYFGFYQVDVLSPIADVFFPSLKFPQKMRSELAAAGLYGWFPSAWGVWIGDAGMVFGSIWIVLWGALSGFCYRLVRHGDCLSAELMLTFCYMSIVLSPISGPFGIANSFLVFLSFVAVCVYSVGYRGHHKRPLITHRPNDP
jgi:hypothetical protein